MPNEYSSYKEFTHLYETIPIYCDTSRNRLKYKKVNNVVPLDITLKLLFYYRGKERMIIKGNMIFDNYVKIPDIKTIDGLFSKRFSFNYSNIVDSNFFNFYKTENEYSYLGLISRYFFYSNYNKTKQFKKHFPDFYKYKTRSYYNSTENNITELSQLFFNENFTKEELENFLRDSSTLSFIQTDDTMIYEKPPSLKFENINTEKQLGDLLSQYNDSMRNYKLNAYYLSISAYKFNVIIRPFTWGEALLNHAFPTYAYISLALIGMVIMNLNYFSYNLSFKLAKLRGLFKNKYQ